MYAYNTEEKFAAAGPAASAVLAHLTADDEIKAARWGFDRGTVSSNGRSSAWAQFTLLPGEPGWGYDKLSISAEEGDPDRYTVKHILGSAGRT